MLTCSLHSRHCNLTQPYTLCPSSLDLVRTQSKVALRDQGVLTSVARTTNCTWVTMKKKSDKKWSFNKGCQVLSCKVDAALNLFFFFLFFLTVTNLTFKINENVNVHRRRPSFSCKMIILWSKNHGEIRRVCMGIFTTALKNKKYSQIPNKNTSPYFHSASLVIWPLTLLKRTHFSKLYLEMDARRSSYSWSLRRLCMHM